MDTNSYPTPQLEEEIHQDWINGESKNRIIHKYSDRVNLRYLNEVLGVLPEHKEGIIDELGGVDWIVDMKRRGFTAPSISVGLGFYRTYVAKYLNRKDMKFSDIPYKTINNEKPTLVDIELAYTYVKRHYQRVIVQSGTKERLRKEGY